MLLIKNGHIKTMVSEDIVNGCVLIGDDGKILAVGKNLSAEDAQVIDAAGRLVTPDVWMPTAILGWTIRLWAGKAGIIMRSPILSLPRCGPSTPSIPWMKPLKRPSVAV